MTQIGSFFDSEAFFKDKVCIVNDITDLKDFDTKEIIGKQVEVGIISDNTEYRKREDGSMPTNRFKTLKVKILGSPTVEVGTTVNSQVVLQNLTCTLYVDRSNSIALSVKGTNDSFRKVQTATKWLKGEQDVIF